MLIRRAGQADLEPALRVMAEAFAMPVQAPSVHTRVAGLPHGRLLVADSGGAIVGTGGAVGFGSTAWIGGVTVAPAARGARLGQRLTEAAIAAVGGASTLLLLASEAGRPIYDRLGFEAEGRYRTFTAPAAPPVRAALVRPERATVLALDARATGEDRSSVLTDEALATPDLGAVALLPPWPALPILARDPAAGETLLRALARPGMRLAVPEANAAAVGAMLALGAQERDPVTRMRRGAAVDWRPDEIWGVFSLFFG